jgi:hypothetical protein
MGVGRISGWFRGLVVGSVSGAAMVSHPKVICKGVLRDAIRTRFDSQ